jgi:osmoprotectant transport system ATP-binding protein
MSGSPVLLARGVSKTYDGGVTALRGVDLSVPGGATCALVGESGSGKSTLLKMFNALVEPTSGDVRVRGEEVARLDPVALRRHMGYVSQEGGLLPHWSVERNAGLVPWLLGWDRAKTRERVSTLMDVVDLPLEEYGRRYPGELSGGQRQRVALVRAFAADPDVVLLDEPFGALDPLTRADLQRELLALQERFHKTTLLVTHDLREALLLGEQVVVLKEGEVHQAAAPDALRREPATPYVADLVEKGLA